MAWLEAVSALDLVHYTADIMYETEDVSLSATQLLLRQVGPGNAKAIGLPLRSGRRLIALRVGAVGQLQGTMLQPVDLHQFLSILSLFVIIGHCRAKRPLATGKP